MSCALSTLKFTTFVMNILLCIFGGMMLSACAYALVAFSASAAIRIPCIIGVVLGGLLFLSTILGCCGTIKESVQLSYTYAVCIALLLASQIVVIFLLPVDYNKLAKETINYAWQQQLYSNDAMSNYEIQYGCCGVYGPNDYAQSGLAIPASCYLYLNQTAPAELFTTGCADRLAFEFEQNVRIEVISDWTLVGVEGITVIIVTVLAISLQNIKRRRLFH